MFERDNTNKQIEFENLTSKAQCDELLAQYQFEKDQLADKDFIKRKRGEVIRQVYSKQGNRMRNFEIFVQADQDPMSVVLDNFMNDVLEE